LLFEEAQKGESAMFTSTRIDQALFHLRGLFLEQPGTPLSADEVRRRSGMDETMCEALLWALENSRFLSRSQTGRFLLRSDPSGIDTTFAYQHSPR